MSTGHLRVALVGNVDAGKSTLAGTLTTNQLDDGNGTNRMLIANHKHEAETGRTSSISTHLLGLDAHGETVVVPINNKSKQPQRREAFIASRSHRTVALMDLAGHEKYFKTTVAGLSRGVPDYALILVNAAQPPTHMTLQHLQVCQMCDVPVIVLLTKTDACPPLALRQSQQRVQNMIRSSMSNKKAYATRNQEDVDMVQNKLHALVPVLQVSCVTGEGLDVLRRLLFTIPRRRLHETKKGRALEFNVHDVFNVTGVGTVLSGFVNCGQYKRGDTVYVGPLRNGDYIKTVAKSLHVAQTSVDEVFAGHSACFAVSLSKAERRLLSRKGMVIVESPVPLSRSFVAEISLVRGDPVTMVKGRSQMIAHILHLKCAVRMVDFEILDCGLIVDNDGSVLRPGQRARVKFSFSARPQFIRAGMRVILRDGHVRGIGKIKETFV